MCGGGGKKLLCEGGGGMVVWRVREQVVVRRGREEMVVRWGREEIVVRRGGGGVQVEEGRVWVELCWGLCGDLTRWMRCLGKSLPFVARGKCAFGRKGRGRLALRRKVVVGEEKWEGRSRRRRNERRGYGGGLRSVEKICSLRKVVVEEKKWEEEKWWLGRSGRRRIGY